jgi:hypothetical protein
MTTSAVFVLSINTFFIPAYCHFAKHHASRYKLKAGLRRVSWIFILKLDLNAADE